MTRHIIDRRNGDRVVPAVITFSSVREMENIVGTRTYEIAARRSVLERAPTDRRSLTFSSTLWCAERTRSHEHADTACRFVLEKEQLRLHERNELGVPHVFVLTLEFVTWSAGTDSGTVCKVLRILADIVGQPVSLPQTLQRFDDAPSPPTPETECTNQRLKLPFRQLLSE